MLHVIWSKVMHAVYGQCCHNSYEHVSLVSMQRFLNYFCQSKTPSKCDLLNKLRKEQFVTTDKLLIIHIWTFWKKNALVVENNMKCTHYSLVLCLYSASSLLFIHLFIYFLTMCVNVWQFSNVEPTLLRSYICLQMFISPSNLSVILNRLNYSDSHNDYYSSVQWIIKRIIHLVQSDRNFIQIALNLFTLSQLLCMHEDFIY